MKPWKLEPICKIRIMSLVTELQMRQDRNIIHKDDYIEKEESLLLAKTQFLAI